jgi:hypothetical protein
MTMCHSSTKTSKRCAWNRDKPYFQYMIVLSLIFELADNQEQAARTVRKLQPLN